MPYDLNDIQLQRDILKWDVATWAQALFYWERVLNEYGYGEGSGAGQAVGAKADGSLSENFPTRHPGLVPGSKQLPPGFICRDLPGQPQPQLQALELGAHDGGLSLYLALRGIAVLCSDIYGPTEYARELHQRHGVARLLSYAALDATAIDAAEASFDIVIFKSVIGGVGTFGSPETIRQVLSEVERVLKPGGLLLFAENQRGAAFHRLARGLFRRWGRQWYYPSLQELDELLSPFAAHQLFSYGYFACCAKDCAPVAALDRLICRKVCSPRHYMAFGAAQKRSADATCRDLTGRGESATRAQALY